MPNIDKQEKKEKSWIDLMINLVLRCSKEKFTDNTLENLIFNLGR